ncbi:MAG TPA: tetratricopeptide repeat protein [Thermoanaerobaculia bacterium]|nr:tetratricopeptide repeat protein [Thermoanaerobaculia bacterium]
MADTGNRSERLSDLRARWEADRRSRLFLQLAEEYRRQGQPLEAMAVLDEGLSRHPSSVAGKVLQGRCRLESGQVEAAAATLEEVVSRDPTHIVAYRWLTESYLELGDAEQARRRLDVYTQLNPQGEDLSDLSRRLVALEDPARRAEGSVQPPSSGTPSRPDARTTEAPTILTPIPPELGDPKLVESEQPTVALRREELSPTPSTPDAARDAPTRAVPLADAERPAAGRESDRDASRDAGYDAPEDVPERGFSDRAGAPALWPWNRREGSGASAETAPASDSAPTADDGDEVVAPHARTEAPTAKHRLASLGLFPDPPAARSGEGDTAEDTADDTPDESAEPDAAEPENGTARSAVPAEAVTAEVPWWRPRPTPSPWDTQEAAVGPFPSTDDPEEPAGERQPPEEREPAGSEAPAGVFDTSALLEPSPRSDDDEDGLSEAATSMVDLAGDEALHPADEERPADSESSDATPAPPLPDASEEIGGQPVEPPRFPGPLTEDEAAVEAAAAPEAAGTPHQEAPAPRERVAEPDGSDLFGLGQAPDARWSRLWGGEGGAPPAPASDPFPELHTGSVDNGSSTVFALDAGDLFDEIDLASIPTRPLSIPFWLTHPGSPARSSRSQGPATPTLAYLYLEQGHATEAEALYGTILEREPENEAAREGLAEVERVRADLSAAALIGDFEPERGGLTAKQVYVLQRYLARLRGRTDHTDVS